PRYTPSTSLPRENRREVRTAPRATSLHFRTTLGSSLKTRANRTVMTTKETTHSALRMINRGGIATECTYRAAADTQTLTISDSNKYRPAESTRAKERRCSFTRLRTLRAWLHVASTGTLQIVFRSSLSSFTTAVAPKNRVSSPTPTAAKPCLGRWVLSIMAWISFAPSVPTML